MTVRALNGKGRATVALAAAILLGGGAWLLWSSAQATAPAPAAVQPTAPNILLITLDTMRADRLGSYGYAGASTPNLDRLAADGVRFDQARSPVPLTLPAHASLLTGRQPFTHGVRNNGHFVLPDDMPTLATALAGRGYDTAAFVSSFVLEKQFGLARGFSHYDDGLDEGVTGAAVSLELERRGDRTEAAARAWLTDPARQASGRPYLAWVHLYDPHEPYAPPSPFREQFAERPYDGEVAFVDTVVGRLLDAAGYSTPRAPLVIVSGDHGESLGEHGESTHGLFVYDATLRVPLVMAWPGVLAPRVVSAPVRLVDVAPTIVEMAGAPALEGAEGQSLRALARGEALPDAPPAAYAETYFPQFFMQWAPLRAIQAGRWKFIDAPEPELYDLQADAGETRNVAAAEPERVRSMARVLAGMTGAGTGRVSSTPLTADARERLASLGYLSAPAPKEPATVATLPDPKRMAPLFERLLAGNRAMAEGRTADAGGIARQVLAEDPSNAYASLLLGRSALAEGRNPEAIAAFTAYLRVVPGSADAHHWLALAYLRSGDRRRALAEEDAALAIDPRLTAALALKAGLVFSSGRREEGVQILRDAVAREASNVALRLEFADLLTDAGRYADAEGEYRRVIAARPRDSRALLGLGLVLGATDRPDAALEPLTEAVTADSRNIEARFARAEVLERLGRLDEARADYEVVAKESPRSDLRRIAAEKITRVP